MMMLIMSSSTMMIALMGGNLVIKYRLSDVEYFRTNSNFVPTEWNKYHVDEMEFKFANLS